MCCALSVENDNSIVDVNRNTGKAVFSAFRRWCKRTTSGISGLRVLVWMMNLATAKVEERNGNWGRCRDRLP
jgi:hypothetical protein